MAKRTTGDCTFDFEKEVEIQIDATDTGEHIRVSLTGDCTAHDVKRALGLLRQSMPHLRELSRKP